MEIKDLDIRIRISIFTMMVISTIVFISSAYVWFELISGNTFKMFTVVLVNIFCFGSTILIMLHSKKVDEKIKRMEEA